jgi:hypothetical protein
MIVSLVRPAKNTSKSALFAPGMQSPPPLADPPKLTTDNKPLLTAFISRVLYSLGYTAKIKFQKAA